MRRVRYPGNLPRLVKDLLLTDRKDDDPPTLTSQPTPAINAFKTSALDQVDLSSSLTPEEYTARLKKAQAKLRELQHQIYRRRVRLSSFWGSDAKFAKSHLEVLCA
jgi:hypothetical protein